MREAVLRPARAKRKAGSGPIPHSSPLRTSFRTKENGCHEPFFSSLLEQERRLSALPPVVIGGALIVPKGLLLRLGGQRAPEVQESRETARIEALAMQAVMATERRLGYEPRDVSNLRCGYDIESRIPGTGKLRFIEVKGRHVNGKTITVTKNEILTALNKPEDFWLAVVQVDGDRPEEPRYVGRPFTREPDFGATSVTYDITQLGSGANSQRT